MIILCGGIISRARLLSQLLSTHCTPVSRPLVNYLVNLIQRQGQKAHLTLSRFWGQGQGVGSQFLSLPASVHLTNWIKATFALLATSHKLVQVPIILDTPVTWLTFPELFAQPSQPRALWQLHKLLCVPWLDRLQGKRQRGLLSASWVPRASRPSCCPFSFYPNCLLLTGPSAPLLRLQGIIMWTDV